MGCPEHKWLKVRRLQNRARMAYLVAVEGSAGKTVYIWGRGVENIENIEWVMRHENISPTDRHSSGIASLNRINGKGNASYQHCPSVTTLTFSISILGVKHYVW